MGKNNIFKFLLTFIYIYISIMLGLIFVGMNFLTDRTFMQSFLEIYNGMGFFGLLVYAGIFLVGVYIYNKKIQKRLI